VFKEKIHAARVHVDFLMCDQQFIDVCRTLQDVTSVTARQYISRVWSSLAKRQAPHLWNGLARSSGRLVMPGAVVGLGFKPTAFLCFTQLYRFQIFLTQFTEHNWPLDCSGQEAILMIEWSVTVEITKYKLVTGVRTT